MRELVKLANEMADEAGKIVLEYFRQDFDIERKGDKTPVTIADRNVEKHLREILLKNRSDDGIIGEEFGNKESKNGLTWIIDPIDGTKSFIIGRPTFGTLIALWDKDTPLLGIIDQPVLNERWIGVKGRQTTFNNKPVKTRKCQNINAASISSTSPSQLPDLWPKLYSECHSVIWGGDCYAYGMLSNGWHDIVIETGMGIHDYAALVPIVEGAGGKMFDWKGAPLSLKENSKIIAIGDNSIKNEVLELVRE